MSKDMVELEEHYMYGVITKRLINGVEVSKDKFPVEFKSQNINPMFIKQTMSVEDAKKIYGEKFDEWFENN